MGGHRGPIAAVSLKTWFLPFSAEKLTGVHRGRSKGSLGEVQSLGEPLREPEGQAFPSYCLLLRSGPSGNADGASALVIKGPLGTLL